MIDTSSKTNFTNWQNSTGALSHIVVSVTDGVDTYYLSDMEMNLTEGHVYSILTTMPSVTESVNIFNKSWQVNNVSITATNLPFKKDSSNNDITFSDLAGDFVGEALKVYAVVSGSLSDGIIIFDGIVSKSPSYDNDKVKVEAVPAKSLINITLPEKYLQDVSGYTPPNVHNDEKVPIVFGEFTFNDTEYNGSGNGLAVAVPNSRVQTNKFVVSDHELNAFSELYFKDELEDPMGFTSPTLNTSETIGSSDYGTATGGTLIYGAMYPDEEEVADRNYTTKITIENNDVEGDQSTYNPQGSVKFTFDNQQFLEDLISYYSTTATFKYSCAYDDVSASNNVSNMIRLIYGTAEINLDAAAAVDKGNGTVGISSTAHGLITGDKITIAGTTNYNGSYRVVSETSNEIVIEKTYAAETFSTSDTITYELHTTNTVLNTSTTSAIATIGSWTLLPSGSSHNEDYEIEIWIKGHIDDDGLLGECSECRLDLRGGMRKRFIGFAACKGKEYDSNITGRSSNYSDGDCIEDPAGIVEWLARDYMGLVDADIDEESFIDAENTSMTARLNLHRDNEMTVINAMRRISEQSTFAIAFTASGTLRAIPLNNSSPSTNRTIIYSHIKNGQLSINKTPIKANVINVRANRQQENNNNYHDLSVHLGSPSDYPYDYNIEYDARWDNLTGTDSGSVNHLADVLINTSTGIWNREHNQIEFTALGATNWDLEVGDWIEIDDTTTDPHIKCYGASWSGKQFLVTSLTKTIDGTKIKAIELY